MLMQEFTDMTGFEPTVEEFDQIEAEYYRFDGDKQAFCKDFVARGGEKQVYARRAEYIKELESQLMDQEKEYTTRLAELTAKNTHLQEELDRELDWQPTDEAGTHMSQVEYEDLARCGEVLNVVRATEIVCREFGFARDRVTVKCEAVTHEKNKYGGLRVKDELERPPVYSSTDWNYVRFDCAGYMYEMVNGELLRYDE